jgi:cysteine desulfuration protein SufE
MSELTPRLQEIVEDFSYCEGQEKLELLLQYSENLPPLPAWLQGKQAEMEQVQECMTPVFIYPEKKEGKLYYHFDIPPESPTVRGFAAVLREGLNGSTPEEVTAVPDAFHLQMGLNQVLSGQRLNGIMAMLAHMKALAGTDEK